MSVDYEFPKVREYAGQLVRYRQFKYDGYCIRITVNEKGKMDVRMKKQSIWDKIRNVPAFAPVHDLPPYTCIFGELFMPCRRATEVPTFINAADPELQLRAFAMPVAGGHEDWFDASLLSVNAFLITLGFIPPTTFDAKLPVRYDIEIEKARATKIGIEGFVLKGSHCEDWFKVKPTQTLDAIVVGMTVSDSLTKFGMMKALQVACIINGKLVEIASVGSGYTDEFRAAISLSEVINRIVEVRYNSWEKDKLRFPRFVRFRDEKDTPDDVTQRG